MENRYRELLSIRASGLVTRWHTVPTITSQNVAEHSGQALSLLFMLHPNPSIRLAMAILWHDTAERHVGDVPAPARRQNPQFAKEYAEAEMLFTREHHPVVHEVLELLFEDEKKWLRAIDVLELLLHCYDEVMLGNSRFHVILKRAREYLIDSDETPDEVRHFVRWLDMEGPVNFA